MDPEVKRQFEELHALAKDNHRLLRAVRRHQILETFGKLFIWIVIFAATGYVYLQYLGPLFDKFIHNPSSVSRGVFGLPTSADLQKLIESAKAGQGTSSAPR